MDTTFLNKNKAVVLSVFTVISICFASTGSAAINGSGVIDFLDGKNKQLSIQEEYQFVSDFFGDVIINKNLSSQEMFLILEKYNSNNKNKISYNSFDNFFRYIEKKFGEELTGVFLSVLLKSLQYIDSSDITLFELNFLMQEKMNYFKEEVNYTYIEINDLINGKKNFNELSDSSLNLIELVDVPTNDNNNFDDYWIEYGRAKGYWHGFYPIGVGTIEPDLNVRDLLWHEPNFYDWFYEASEYIYGEDGWQLRDFEGWNLAGGALFSLCMVVVIISFIIGLSDPTYFLVAVFPGLLAPLLGLTLLFYDYLALTHFLFGTNSFLRLLSADFVEDDEDYWESNEVNIIVNVINETNITMPGCTIYANNTDISLKDPNPIEWGNWVNELGSEEVWDQSEFNYILGELIVENNNILYCLFNRDKPKYDKTVPPPGDWSLFIKPPPGSGYVGGPIPQYKIPILETGDTVFINVIVSKDKPPQ